eukprot:777596-Pyramimonas_sp.AAC.2
MNRHLATLKGSARSPVLGGAPFVRSYTNDEMSYLRAENAVISTKDCSIAVLTYQVGLRAGAKPLLSRSAPGEFDAPEILQQKRKK